ncbi:MAG: PqqD family protein [Candidatus Hydrogenedentes bacterium]|nr:PqqD family protein [Candidatus Hydrogenedentota bacterium]
MTHGEGPAGAGAPLPRKRAGVQVQEFGGEVVLFDEDGRRVHVLNATAQAIWRSCDGVTTLESLVGELAAAFSGVDDGTLRADIAATLERFRAEGLLESAAAP